MEKLIERLKNEQCSCVIRQGDDLRIGHERGVKDLYHFYRTEPQLLKGADVADKVVGKGAAAVMAAAGVRRVYAGVISLPALVLLKKSGIEVHFDKLAPFILNRSGSGWCPLEERCQWERELPELIDTVARFLNQQAATATQEAKNN